MYRLNKTTNFSQETAQNGITSHQLVDNFYYDFFEIDSICSKVLLDPPANVTVTNNRKQGQLNVSWVPPPLKYMDDSMVYEVSYRAVDSQMMQV